MNAERSQAHAERSHAVASWENEGGAIQGVKQDTEQEKERERFVPLFMYPAVLMARMIARLRSRAGGT